MFLSQPESGAERNHTSKTLSAGHDDVCTKAINQGRAKFTSEVSVTCGENGLLDKPGLTLFTAHVTITCGGKNITRFNVGVISSSHQLK
jgi:hypothetical protein